MEVGVASRNSAWMVARISALARRGSLAYWLRIWNKKNNKLKIVLCGGGEHMKLRFFLQNHYSKKTEQCTKVFEKVPNQMFLQIKFATFWCIENWFLLTFENRDFWQKSQFSKKFAESQNPRKSTFNTTKCSKFNFKKHLFWHFFEIFHFGL